MKVSPSERNDTLFENLLLTVEEQPQPPPPPFTRQDFFFFFVLKDWELDSFVTVSMETARGSH